MNIIDKIIAWLGNNNEFCGYYPPVVKYKKLHPNAVAPRKAHVSDAGWDLTAVSYEWDDDGCLVYHTGLAFAIPDGYCGLLFPRSSNAKKDLILSNSVGVLDCHYRGEVLFKFKPTNRVRRENVKCYYVGDRIGQMVIMPIYDFDFREAEELDETDRGAGGYGSSGA